AEGGRGRLGPARRAGAPPGHAGPAGGHAADRWLAGRAVAGHLPELDGPVFPAWKARTNPRFAEINRPVTHPQLKQAQELARAAAGLWRLDDRWGEGI